MQSNEPKSCTQNAVEKKEQEKYKICLKFKRNQRYET